MSRIADRARANEVQESDRKALAQRGAGRPVTTLPAITHSVNSSKSIKPSNGRETNTLDIAP